MLKGRGEVFRSADIVSVAKVIESEIAVSHGGGFFVVCGNLGRMFGNSFPACAFFFFF